MGDGTPSTGWPCAGEGAAAVTAFLRAYTAYTGCALSGESLQRLPYGENLRGEGGVELVQGATTDQLKDHLLALNTAFEAEGSSSSGGGPYAEVLGIWGDEQLRHTLVDALARHQASEAERAGALLLYRAAQALKEGQDTFGTPRRAEPGADPLAGDLGPSGLPAMVREPPPVSHAPANRGGGLTPRDAEPRDRRCNPGRVRGAGQVGPGPHPLGGHPWLPWRDDRSDHRRGYARPRGDGGAGRSRAVWAGIATGPLR